MKKITEVIISDLTNGVVASITVKGENPYSYDYKRTHFASLQEAADHVLKVQAGLDEENNPVLEVEKHEDNVTELAGGECPF